MNGFYFAFIAVLLSGLGARDQITIAGIAARQGARPALLLAGIAVSIATAAFAAWAAASVAPLLPRDARLVLCALALALAGLESLLLGPLRRPAEPTASLGAFVLVLLAHQLTDAARFLVFAVAVVTSSPIAAGIGGAVGGGAVIAAGWLFPAVCTHRRIGKARRAVGAGLLLLSGWFALRISGRL